MKLAIVAMTAILTTSALAQNSGTMIAAEKLTDQEKKMLSEAYAKVSDAAVNLRVTKEKIAAQHSMKEEHWMEWSSWYEFDGDYIVKRYQSHMAY